MALWSKEPGYRASLGLKDGEGIDEVEIADSDTLLAYAVLCLHQSSTYNFWLLECFRETAKFQRPLIQKFKDEIKDDDAWKHDHGDEP